MIRGFLIKIRAFPNERDPPFCRTSFGGGTSGTNLFQSQWQTPKFVA
jgi:hypothetical protein